MAKKELHKKKNEEENGVGKKRLPPWPMYVPTLQPHKFLV